jgi:hypothetical protein
MQADAIEISAFSSAPAFKNTLRLILAHCPSPAATRLVSELPNPAQMASFWAIAGR